MSRSPSTYHSKHSPTDFCFEIQLKGIEVMASASPKQDKPATIQTSPVAVPASPSLLTLRRLSLGGGNDGAGAPIYKVLCKQECWVLMN